MSKGENMAKKNDNPMNKLYKEILSGVKNLPQTFGEPKKRTRKVDDSTNKYIKEISSGIKNLPQTLGKPKEEKRGKKGLPDNTIVQRKAGTFIKKYGLWRKVKK
jgi:hypothetical protein